jgi:hypothetical protein
LNFSWIFVFCFLSTNPLQKSMLSVTLLAFGLVQSQSICLDATVSGILTGAETSCPGSRACFDGCKVCGSGKALCEATVVEVTADPACACDFWMCYSFCAKANCEEAILPSASAYCLAMMQQPCAHSCTGAWMLSAAVPLMLLALFH